MKTKCFTAHHRVFQSDNEAERLFHGGDLSWKGTVYSAHKHINNYIHVYTNTESW